MREKISLRNTHIITEDAPGSSKLVQNLERLQIEFKIANATNLARRGYYTQAEALISDILNVHGENAGILDLQARILAQQGRLFEAEALWRKASFYDPSNRAYQAALLRIAKFQQRPIWLIPLFRLLMGVFFIAAIVFGIITVMNQIKQNVNKSNVDGELLKKVTSLESLIADSSRSQLPPHLDISMPDISMRDEGNERVIIFKKGLFEKGAILRPDAKILLADLGKRLGVYGGRILIKIYGITNNIPLAADDKYRDNFDLGKARAVAVYDHFRETTNLTADRLLIGSFGEKLPPFPNDTPEGRAKNQTVIIKITHSRE